MLFSLHVENVALLRSLDLDLSGGLTVFTRPARAKVYLSIQ